MIDSGGGHVAGNFDLVDKIFEGGSVKPIRAYASEHGYSAAYSIASAADSVTVSRTGGVGSIGVVTVHLDVSKAMDQDGNKITFIHYGKHKVDGNPYEPLPPEVEKRIQARINELGEVFVSSVARNRSMDVQAVRDTEALTFTAKEATSNGLADSIGSLDDAIAVFEADMSNQEEDDMSNPQLVYNARSEGLASGTLAGKREGAPAERNRICAILDSDEGKKRPVAARAAAFDTDLSTEQASVFLGKLPDEKSGASYDGLTRAQRAAQLSRRSVGSSPEQGDAQPLRAQRALTLVTGPMAVDGSQLTRAQAAAEAAGRLKIS